jgi:hypothetical protein
MSRSATLFSQEGVSGGYGSEADRPVTITHFLTCRWIQAWKNKILKDFPGRLRQPEDALPTATFCTKSM